MYVGCMGDLVAGPLQDLPRFSSRELEILPRIIAKEFLWLESKAQCLECKVLGLLSCLYVYIKALAASRAVSTGPISALPTRPGLSQKRGADTDAVGTPMQLGEVFFGSNDESNSPMATSLYKCNLISCHVDGHGNKQPKQSVKRRHVGCLRLAMSTFWWCSKPHSTIN